LTVSFDASASKDDDGTVASYNWNYGDAASAGAGVTSMHAFQSSGTFTVTLTVTDNRGATGSASRLVTVGQAASLTKIATIDNGDMNVCAVGLDGSAWCWGPNDYGQLATGDTQQAYVPKAAAAGYSFGRISVSTGGAFACGITTAGPAYCWGSREGGRLGDGTPGPSGSFITTPVPVAGGHSFTDMAAGGDHACAIAQGGEAYCWGHNERGQLGTGNVVNSATPVAVSGGLKFTSITAHQMVTCGITENGAGYCWGNGAAGNLGSGTTNSTNVPTPVKGELKWSALRLGVWTACGVTVAGEGYCWGSNGSGELGIGSKVPSEALEPLKVVGNQAWTSISPGAAVTCGVNTAGRGFCWGGNAWGERGTGPFPASDETSPVPVAGDLAFESIDADWCSCGVADGAAYCWGPGTEGCVGDGAKVNRGVPTKALFP